MKVQLMKVQLMKVQLMKVQLMKVQWSIVLICLSVFGCDKAEMVHSKTNPAITIENSWIRQPVPGSANTSGFITITNHSDKTERLVAANSELAAQTELHTMTMENGVMQMRPLPQGFVIPAGERLTLVPGGEHIMFLGLQQSLTTGQSFKLMLEFEHAGRQQVEFEVRAGYQTESHLSKPHNGH